MKGALVCVATISAFSLIEAMFGRAASVWCALIALAFCVGVFWGAGAEIRKHREHK